MEDAATGADAFRVVGGVEDATLDLATLAHSIRGTGSTYPHEVQHTGAWDCHGAQCIGAMRSCGGGLRCLLRRMLGCASLCSV
jgi:hypothetical protein